jgi:actin-like ATPase involved in cell morphogenesis
MSFILGLDVGTASGAGATKRDGRVQPCALGNRTATLPAVVVLHDDGTALVGEQAERVAGLELTRVARDLRYDPVLQTTPIKVGGEIHTPHELLRTLYAAMVQKVSAAHGAAPNHVVLTHPALPEGMRCDTVDRIADELFPGALVVPEPVAAAVKLACDGVLPAECLVAVYDFGGGTFDTTLVQRDGDRFSVLGDPAGLGDFGGIDIDDLILDHVDRSLDGAIARLDMSDPASIIALTRLRAECRDAKERLSYDSEVTIDASLPHLPSLVQLTRAEFEDIVRPRLETTIDVVLDMVDRAGFRTSEVDAVALTGGSSRIPAVVDLLTARTNLQVLVDPYPELTVALGAAQMVDDEVGPSVFPLADMALPSLGALGAVATTSLVGAAGDVDHGLGPAMTPPPGALSGPVVLSDETRVEDFDMFGRPVEAAPPTTTTGTFGSTGPFAPPGPAGAFASPGVTGAFAPPDATEAFGSPGSPGSFGGFAVPDEPTVYDQPTGFDQPTAFGRSGGYGEAERRRTRSPMSPEEEAFGAALDDEAGDGLSDRLGRFTGGIDPQKVLVGLACVLAVLLFGGIVVALTGGGGGDDDNNSTTVTDGELVDETAGTSTDPDSTTSSNPSTSSSSSSTSTTTGDDEPIDDDGDPATPPVVPTTEDDGSGPGPTSPGTTTRPTTTRPPTPPTTNRPPPTTTTTSTTTSTPPTTETTTTTTEATTTSSSSTNLEPTLRDDPPTE